MLEAAQYENNAFVTLTYNDEHLSKLSAPCGLPSLDPKAYRYWLDRMRKEIGYSQLRYFIAGEYGDETERPHYHVALFNFATCLRGRTYRRPGSSRPLWDRCCPQCKLVGDTWGKGDVDLGTLETDSAQYISGYVTKKMTSKNDARLLGRYPEFSRQSTQNGGIGSGLMHDVASTLMSFNLDTTQSDVPVTLRHGNRELPLGRYLRRKLRVLMGQNPEVPEAKVREILNEKIEKEVLPVLAHPLFSEERKTARAKVEKKKLNAQLHADRKSDYQQRGMKRRSL